MKISVVLLLSLLSLQSMAVMNGRTADITRSRATIMISPVGVVRQCTAVIVAPHLIFTAGHCTEGMQSPFIRVKISNQLKADVKKTINVLQWRTAAGYSESGTKEPGEIQYDFAFLRVREDLMKEFNLTTNDLPQVPASLGEVKKALAKTVNAMAYGYGRFDKNKTGEKRELNLATELIEELGVIKAISQENGRGICEGDSGGGLFKLVDGKLILLGNVSGIVEKKGCGTPESYAVYSLVSAQLCWVKKASGLAPSNMMGNLNCR